ncbi:hypothetical protein SDC9_115658 [bioreactor metagenome]|uniref:Uncharacterized protein n=1 Tax=bioreactor metagenome TaxID=1076179 RepID=A0A645C444_9ZZZZ
MDRIGSILFHYLTGHHSGSIIVVIQDHGWNKITTGFIKVCIHCASGIEIRKTVSIDHPDRISIQIGSCKCYQQRRTSRQRCVGEFTGRTTNMNIQREDRVNRTSEIVCNRQRNVIITRFIINMLRICRITCI